MFSNFLRFHAASSNGISGSAPRNEAAEACLESQRHEIADFGAREGFAVNSWYQDVQTGRGADALQLRPGLAAALKEATVRRCPLIVLRLDRLAHNVHLLACRSDSARSAALRVQCTGYYCGSWQLQCEVLRNLIAGVSRACALYLPKDIAAEVKIQLSAGAIVTDFVFDVLLRDRLIASDACVPAISSANATPRYKTRQLAALDVLLDSEPQLGIVQL